MTTLDKWTPLNELELMERRMRSLFNTVGFIPGPLPAADVYETDEAPGFAEKEPSVEVSDHTLTIKGARSETKDESEKSFRFHERLEREFERRFPLPETADPERLKARVERGLIEVRASKVKTAKSRRVPIGKA